MTFLTRAHRSAGLLLFFKKCKNRGAPRVKRAAHPVFWNIPDSFSIQFCTPPSRGCGTFHFVPSNIADVSLASNSSDFAFCLPAKRKKKKIRKHNHTLHPSMPVRCLTQTCSLADKFNTVTADGLIT